MLNEEQINSCHWCLTSLGYGYYAVCFQTHSLLFTLQFYYFLMPQNIFAIPKVIYVLSLEACLGADEGFTKSSQDNLGADEGFKESSQDNLGADECFTKSSQDNLGADECFTKSSQDNFIPFVK